MDKTVLLIMLLSGLNTLTSCLSHQYHMVNMNKTWTEAQSYCRETYTDLATISDSEEYNRLVNMLYSLSVFSGEAWIGLKFSRWRWSLENNETEEISNGWPTGYPWDRYAFIYSNWQKTCVTMTSSGMWNVYSCNSANFFVCYDGSQNANQTFVLVKEWMTWYQAQSYCRDHYTDLAIVRNQTENQAIQNLTMIVNSSYTINVGNQTGNRAIQNISWPLIFSTFNVGNQTGNQSLVNQTQTYYIPTNMSVWIGLYRDVSWSDGSNSSFSLYANSYDVQDVVGLNESCVTVQSSPYFYDIKIRNCNKTLPFVCYSGLCSSSPNISHQYHMVNMNKTWTEAQSYCRETYTDLATVSDPEEYSSLTCLINSTLGYSGKAWIGMKINWRWSLEDTDAEGISNGWPGGFPWSLYGYWYWYGYWFRFGSNFSNWQLCVLSYNGQWEEYYCGSSQYIVCYDGRQNATQTFVLVKISMTWYEAQSYCRDNYTDLATVRNQTENQAIQNLTTIVNYYTINVGNQTGNQTLVNQTQTYYIPVWIGLYSNGSWSDGSQSLSYIPVHGFNGSCVTAQYDWNYQYHTENCNNTLPFICYGERKNTPLVQTTEPATTQPLTTEPATTQPLTTEPATTLPLTTEATTPSANSGSRYVVVLRMKLSSLTPLTDNYINSVVLQKLHEELIRRGLPEKFTLQLKDTFGINP